MSGGSMQQRLFRRAIRDGKTLMTACVESGLSHTEGKLLLAADAADPPPEEAYELIGTARKEDDMTRGKKSTPISGELPKPDFDLAAEIHRDEIAPANKEQKQAMKEASDGWKRVKKEAHLHVGAARAAFNVCNLEDAERDVWLRTFRGVLKRKGVGLTPDLVDQAEEAEMDDDGIIDPIPTVAKEKPSLMQVN